MLIYSMGRHTHILYLHSQMQIHPCPKSALSILLYDLLILLSITSLCPLLRSINFLYCRYYSLGAHLLFLLPSLLRHSNLIINKSHFEASMDVDTESDLTFGIMKGGTSKLKTTANKLLRYSCLSYFLCLHSPFQWCVYLQPCACVCACLNCIVIHPRCFLGYDSNVSLLAVLLYLPAANDHIHRETGRGMNRNTRSLAAAP